MATRFIQDVARLCHVQVSDLGIDGHYEIPAQNRIVKDFILEKAVKPGSKPSDEFMHFMAEWGQECISRDAETGWVLMDLALSLVSAVVADEVEMTEGCWAFLRHNIKFCLQFENSRREDAKHIILGLLSVLNEDGTTNNGFCWDETKIGTSVKEAQTILLRIAGSMISFYEIVPVLAPHWRQNRTYFQTIETIVDWNCRDIYKAFRDDEAVDKQGNPYFNRRSKFFLKMFGLYQFALIIQIRQDMRVLPE